MGPMIVAIVDAGAFRTAVTLNIPRQLSERRRFYVAHPHLTADHCNQHPLGLFKFFPRLALQVERRLFRPLVGRCFNFDLELAHDRLEHFTKRGWLAISVCRRKVDGVVSEAVRDERLLLHSGLDARCRCRPCRGDGTSARTNGRCQRREGQLRLGVERS